MLFKDFNAKSIDVFGCMGFLLYDFCLISVLETGIYFLFYFVYKQIMDAVEKVADRQLDNQSGGNLVVNSDFYYK